MKILSLRDATESVLFSLINEDQDWSFLIKNLEETAGSRKPEQGMECHHIEPLRQEEIYLWPLEHLAIHICHAKVEHSDSHNAKVAAFVRPFPGGYRRLLTLTEPLFTMVLSLGQSRPSNKGQGKLQHIHQDKDERGRSLVAVRATRVSVLKRQIPIKVTDLVTGEVTVYRSVKEAAECTGIYRQRLSSYLTGYVKYLPKSVRNRYSYSTDINE